jgi:hypothetical protein
VSIIAPSTLRGISSINGVVIGMAQIAFFDVEYLLRHYTQQHKVPPTCNFLSRMNG